MFKLLNELVEIFELLEILDMFLFVKTKNVRVMYKYNLRPIIYKCIWNKRVITGSFVFIATKPAHHFT